MGPFGFHPLWLILLLVIVLMIFGPGRLPELGSAIGRGLRELQRTLREQSEEVKSAASDTRDEPSTPAGDRDRTEPERPS